MTLICRVRPVACGLWAPYRQPSAEAQDVRDLAITFKATVTYGYGCDQHLGWFAIGSQPTAEDCP